MVFRQCLIVLCVLILSACSEKEIKAAGVIVQSQKSGIKFLLLADHSGASAHRGYGAFGGGLDKGETIQQGALREFHEETACHFLNQAVEVSQQYVRNGKYVSFVVKVPFIEESLLNAGPASSDCDGGVFSERSNWVLVEQTEFLKQIEKGDSFKTNTLGMPVWKKSSIIFLKAQQAGLL